MKPPFKFIMILVAAAGLLLALSPATSEAADNTAYGVGALQSGTTKGVFDSAFGFDALYHNTTGAYNTATGGNALFGNITGSYNTADGQGALTANISSYNTAVGVQALHLNTTGGFNTAIGNGALYSSTNGASNTASGYEALYSNTSGYDNTATGVYALDDNTTGYFNLAEGVDALYSNTTGYENTASGVEALYSNSTGSENVASGYEALYSNSTGGGNVAAGVNALYSNTTADANVAIGYNALFTNTSADSNVAIGTRALESDATGIGNTVVGASTMIDCTGGYNIGLGYNAGSALTSGNFNIDIGDWGQVGDILYTDDLPGDTNTIRIGEIETQTATYIAGIYNQSYNSNDSPKAVFIDATGKLGTNPVTPSSRQFKKEIKPMGDASGVILSLKPVTFQYIKPEYDPRGGQEFGLIAEDVDKVCPDLVAHNKDGQIYGIRYDAVNAMLLNEFLKEHDKVSKLEATVTAQAKAFAQQEQEIKDLTASLKEQASLLQKVSAQFAAGRPVPQLAANVR